MVSFTSSLCDLKYFLLIICLVISLYLFIYLFMFYDHKFIKKINVDQRGHAAAYLTLIGIFAENL